MSKQKRQSKRSLKKQAAGISDASAYELPIMELARAYANGLIANGVGGVRILNARELESWNAGVTNITDMPEFYQKQHYGQLGPRDHLPKKRICVTKTASIFDNSTFTFLRVTGLPSPVPPHFLRQLHAMPVRWKSISLVGETINSTGDYLALGKLSSLMESFL